MIERDRTPATARDGEDAAGGSDSQNPPKLAVGGDDEGDDEGEGEDYVYVGDDWKDVGPSLIPSIVTAAPLLSTSPPTCAQLMPRHAYASSNASFTVSKLG